MLRTVVFLPFACVCSSLRCRRHMGQATVIDGDTIEIHGQRIRLFGIDAPEAPQTCTASGKTYLCGQQAALALADQIGRSVVTCEQRDIDRYGRIVAICFAGGADLGSWLVEQGWALAFRRYSTAYVAQEQSAEPLDAECGAARLCRRGTGERVCDSMTSQTHSGRSSWDNRSYRSFANTSISIHKWVDAHPLSRRVEAVFQLLGVQGCLEGDSADVARWLASCALRGLNPHSIRRDLAGLHYHFEILGKGAAHGEPGKGIRVSPGRDSMIARVCAACSENMVGRQRARRRCSRTP